ncbi:MAG: acyl-CoA carboxylase subunit beta [Desulfatiglans sp.]|jgi:acetyl-CoA/propionyl-CoA carboxylase|nr:acyl-CoA carboxylase subunit beta [Thermodesulfobacteriota bacterium]MEE4354679.1 acyl-CoA carboxylase subunit beta [Desulfatiglans sp.]
MGRSETINPDDVIEDLLRKREDQKKGGGEKAVANQRGKDKLLARERVELLFDEGTFCELDLWAEPLRTGFDDVDEKHLPGDASVIGYGKVNGRPVMVYAHDFTQMTGTQSAVQHSKITKAMDMAVKMNIPYVGIVDSAGIRLQDMMGEPLTRPPVRGHGLGECGNFMFSPPNASGVIPQIALMLGPQFAGSSYSPIMKDFLIMRKSPNVFMSLISPPVIKEVVGEEVTYDEIGSALVHAEITGTTDLVVDTDEEGIETVKELLSFLPSNWKERPPVIETDDPPDRKDQELLDISLKESEDRDMHDIIQRIVDNGKFFETKPLFAKNMIVGFARFNGQTAGIVANNPKEKQGKIDIDVSDKAARFIRFCDCFNIPLVFLVDSIGFVSSKEEEKAGLERHAAKLPYAICESTVPKITIYTGECSGGAEYMMGTESMGVDLVLAWPTATIGQIDPERAVDINYEKELREAENPEKFREEKIRAFKEEICTVYHAGARQLVNDIVDPRSTRPMIIQALDCFKNKEETLPAKKHGNIPL